MHNHKLVLSLGLVVALITGVILGSMVFGKQGIQDKIEQIHTVRVTKSFQDLNSSSTEIPILDLPAGADILAGWIIVNEQFESSLSEPELILYWKTWSQGITCSSPNGAGPAPFIIKGNITQERSAVGTPQYMAAATFCDPLQETNLFVEGNQNLIQGSVDFIVSYMIH